MVDYHKSTGSTGDMMIRDTGSTVEFWLRAGSATFNHDLPWRYTINGSTSSWREFNFVSGGDWQKLGGWNISSTQTVTFWLGDTGTSGLGGPTTFSHLINRDTIPPAPTCVPSATGPTTIFVNSDSRGDGGDPFIQWQVGYGTSSTTPTSFRDLSLSNGQTTITGLASGVTYYLWCRARNSVGWSAWSGRTSARTWSVPAAPTAVELSEVTQNSVKAVFHQTSNGGTTVLEWQLGYGTSPTTQLLFLSSSGTSTVTGLDPGKTHYFWARGRNSVGWGPWSVVSSVQLIAGAWIKDGVGINATWKRAVPYVNVGGTWKLARPWVKTAGLWKETT